MGNLVVKIKKASGELRLAYQYTELAEDYFEKLSVEEDAQRISDFFKNLKFAVGSQTDDSLEDSSGMEQLLNENYLFNSQHPLVSSSVNGSTDFFPPYTTISRPPNPFLALPGKTNSGWNTPNATSAGSQPNNTSNSLAEQRASNCHLHLNKIASFMSENPFLPMPQEQPLPATLQRASSNLTPENPFASIPGQSSRRFERKRSKRTKLLSKHRVSSPANLEIILEHPDECLKASNQRYISFNSVPSSNRDVDSSTAFYENSKKNVDAFHTSISPSERLV